MSFPLRISDQLKPHLRALRKSLGLTQAQLGVLVGVKQARIAEIEANPGAVSLDQLTKVLAALGGTLHLHSADGVGTEGTAVPVARRKAPPAALEKTPARPEFFHRPRGAAAALLSSGDAVGPVAKRARKQAVPTGIVFRPKKGTW